MAVSTRNTKRYLWIGSVREVLSNSLWFVPLLLIVGYGILAQAIVAFDGALENWVPYSFTGGATSAQDLLSTIAAAILSMSTLVLSVTIVALQLGTFVYSILVLRAVVPRSDSLDQFVPSVAISVGFALTLVSLGGFIFYVNHVAHAIRVVHIIESVAIETRATIGHLIGAGTVPDPATLPGGPPDVVLGNPQRPGMVTGIDNAGLVALARQHRCCIGVVPYVGDFVPFGAPLARVWFDPGHEDAPSAEQVRDHIALSRERTMGQDVAFGFRQLVDIAEKALSPGINDPTTAVQALDQIHDLLRRLAVAEYPTGYYVDEPGALRAMRPTHRWVDYIDLGLTADAPLRAVPVDEHRKLLDRSIIAGLADPHDRALALIPDEQGLGGGPH